mmetsp:Transcript_108439/g.336982  ORF Transcript_108439/g.336982 Transcript_108439/m.336982 type:complete len:93 (-) Transcript_108439:151-429(-)
MLVHYAYLVEGTGASQGPWRHGPWHDLQAYYMGLCWATWGSWDAATALWLMHLQALGCLAAMAATGFVLIALSCKDFGPVHSRGHVRRALAA